MFFTLLMAAQAATAQPAPTATVPIYGLANASCAEWTGMKQDPALRAAQAGFVSGVLTGANLAAQSHVTGQVDRDRLLAHLDQQCAQGAAQDVKIAVILNAVLGSLRTAS